MGQARFFFLTETSKTIAATMLRVTKLRQDVNLLLGYPEPLFVFFSVLGEPRDTLQHETGV